MAASNAVLSATVSSASPPTSVFLMLNSFETGGSERQFVMLAQNLNRTKFQLHLGCLSNTGSLAGQFDNVPEFPMGGSLYGWRSVRARLDLRRRLQHDAAQVAHAFDFYTNLALIPAARLAGVPVIVGSQRQLGDLLSPSQSHAQTLAFRWCDAVVCNSQAAADRLAEAGLRRDKLVVIGNILSPEAFQPAVPAIPRQPGILRIGMVARMNHAYKGHAGFLRIAAAIHEQMADVEFVLAGDGPLRPELERQAAALGLGQRVYFLGDRRDIPSVLASVDVAVLTSDSESLSNAILEAMAAGLPAVAYNVGGNAELVNAERGILVAAGSEQEFAAAVLRLLRDSSLRDHLGANARRFAEENFGLHRVCQRYEQLYLDLLDRKRGRKTNA